MRITTSKENLLLAVNAVQRAINSRSIIPMYSCIKITAADDKAIFTGAGLDVGIECTVPVLVEQEGTVLAPARHFSDIVRRLPDIPITLEHSDSAEMTIRYEKSVFTLRTIPADDFPQMPVFGDHMDMTIPADTIKKLIRQSTFAASTDELKAVFTGILWEVDGDEISLVGTDTHRLAWARGQVTPMGDAAKLSFIIPAKIAIEISRLIQDDACSIKVDGTTVFFSFDNIRISCQQLQGSFPNYRQVIPASFITTVRAEGSSFRNVVERISLFATATDSSSTINMEIRDGSLSIHSRSDIGFGREEIPVRQEGEDLDISFNARYIGDAFKATEGDEICIKLSGKLSAGVMTDEQDSDFLYLVLPVRV